MPTISGSLNLVTNRPVDSISEVWVRARETRGQGDGLVVGVNDRIPVAGGVVEFTALPGPAVLVLVHNGMPVETLPMLVGEEAQQSLRLVVQAGEAAGSTDQRIIEQFAAEIAANVVLAEQYWTESAASASAAKTSETNVKTSETKAKTSETKAKTSETNAKTSETNAAGSAATAKSQQQSAWSHFNNAVAEAGKAADSAAAAKTSETNAASYKQAAASSASNAATHETNAGESATAAADSATEAAGHAERAEQMADPTGLRTEVMQQIADLVDGAPEDLDTIREVAEYAQNNRDITDQLNAAIGAKANKSHTHTQAQVTGLTAALDGKADKTHTHTQAQVTGLSTALDGKANASHTHTTEQVTGLDTALSGKANASHTHTQAQVTGLSTALNSKANKTYVDSRPALFSGSGTPPTSIAGAVVGDFWLDTDTMELHKITGV